MKIQLICLIIWLQVVGLYACNPPAGQGQVYAVVVGIADYKALSLQTGDLLYADRDAQRFASFLQSSTGGSVPASHIRLLLNQQATKENIQNALQLFAQAQANDRVIFYFSGHGIPQGFIPYDVRPVEKADQLLLLTHDDVKQAFRQSEASTRLCIADACYAGNLAQQRHRPTPNVSNDTTTHTALLLATRSTQKALESIDFQGGVFTHFLIQGLQAPADRNHDRVVTIRELYDYITPQMRRIQIPQKGAGVAIQAPLFYGRFPDSMPLAYL